MTRLTAFAAAVALGASAQALSAQEISHKQADNFANWLVVDGQHGKAAKLYADAFEEKASNAYGYQAAELYYYVKDYAQAAKFYEAIAKKTDDYPDAGFKYAQALKRMGRFDDARAAFEAHLRGYTEADSAKVRVATDSQLDGIKYAQAEKTRVDPTVFVDKLGGSVNSMKNEIAPVMMGQTLVFSSDFDGTMRAYSSTRGREGWSQMRPAPALPVIEEGHLGGGTLVSEGHFVFSLCEQAMHMAQPAVACTIQEVTRAGGAWGEPRPVPGDVNVDGATAAHPFIFAEDGKEVMLFASDRAGTTGGMDLWRSERAAGDGEAAWGTPVNLGTGVNSAGHDVTPFFNPETRVLSFASDGDVTLGGYDILQVTAKGAGLAEWTARRNPGTPVNSSGDDYYYREVVGQSKAYLSSNRSEDLRQTALSNEDIFVVTYDNPNIRTEFAVIDDHTGMPVSDPTITVYVNPDGLERKPMLAQRSINGTYSLMLPVDREIAIEVERPYTEGSKIDLLIPYNESDGYTLPSARLRRSDIGPDDIAVVDGLPNGGERDAEGNEVMTASGKADQ